MICRQCEPWKPAGELTTEQAIDHLVRMHPGRAETFIKKIVDLARLDDRVKHEFITAELQRALSHRSEYNNDYGVYE